MRKKKTKDSGGFQENLVFCTECGKELDNICFDDKQMNDKDYLEKHHEKCRKTGKFKGDICSRMFIANDSGIEEIFLDED